MNLFGPTKTKSHSGNYFIFVLINNFSRFTWVLFLEHKDEAFSYFHVFKKIVEKEKDLRILRIRSDRGGEFINHSFITYWKKIESNMSYHVLELYNKMELLKGKIVLFKKWLGQ